MSRLVLIACVVAITVLTTPFNVKTVHSLTACEKATTLLKPCTSYVFSLFPVNPTPECCKNLDTINRDVKTDEDRYFMCICLSTEAAMTTVDPKKFADLPKLCGLTLFAPVGPNFDCNT